MFEQLVESSPVRKKRGRWLYFTCTAVIWLSALTSALVVGVLTYDARLNKQFEVLALATPLPPPAPAARTTPPSKAPHAPQLGFVTPRKPPQGISPPLPSPPIVTDPGLSAGVGGGVSGVPGGVDVGVPGGVQEGVSGGVDSGAVPPPPAEVKHDVTPKTPKMVPKASSVLQGSATRRVEPVYPIVARQVGISGQVIVEVVIDEQGNVKSARALSGHPLLKQAALEAAQRWKWNPTRLNGVPVQVVGSITFNFNLN